MKSFRPLDQIVRDIEREEAEIEQRQLRVKRYRAELEELSDALADRKTQLSAPQPVTGRGRGPVASKSDTNRRATRG